MKIRITIKRGGELRAVLEAVNGRASTHTVSGYSDLALFVDAAERQLSALPKREHIGVVASCVPSGPLSRSYKYDAVSTQVEITRFASGWFLTGAGRATVQPCAKEAVRLAVSAGQAAAIREHAVSQFVVAEPTAVKVQNLIRETHRSRVSSQRISSQVCRCRCGAELPTVSNDETPPEFCSEECKEKELVLCIADLLADLPDPLLALMERAFSGYASSIAVEEEQDHPGVVAEAQQLHEATQIARCL